MCRIFAMRGERSPRENPLNGDFGGFPHGEVSPRQAKIRQTVAENATHGMWRTFVWRAEKSPKVTIWRVIAWRLFAFMPRKHAYTTWHQSATIA